jgi:hypothetical protein
MLFRIFIRIFIAKKQGCRKRLKVANQKDLMHHWKAVKIFFTVTTGNSLGKSLGKSLGAVEKQNLPRCLTLILVVRSQ